MRSLSFYGWEFLSSRKHIKRVPYMLSYEAIYVLNYSDFTRRIMF